MKSWCALAHISVGSKTSIAEYPDNNTTQNLLDDLEQKSNYRFLIGDEVKLFPIEMTWLSDKLLLSHASESVFSPSIIRQKK